MGVYKGLDEGGRPILRYFGPAEDAHARAQGFTPASDTEAAQEAGGIDDRTGGVLGAVGAGASSLLSGATLGASDVALRGILSDAEMARLAADRADHSILSGVGSVAGAIAPAFLTGGGSLPSSLATRAGAGIAERLGGGLAARAAGGAAEGAILGAGQGVSDLALSRDPLTFERAASTIGSNALFGGAVGGIAGVGSALVERGLQRASRAIDEGMAARAAQDSVPEDLAKLDAKGLKAARDAELDKLAEAQTSQRTVARSSVVDDVVAYRGTVEDANPWLAISEGEDAARLTKANKALRNALDDAKGLRENPGSLAKPLRVEEKALENAIANRADIAARLDAANQKIAQDLSDELATLPDKATTVDLTGSTARRYASFADVKLSKGKALSVARGDVQEFLDALKNGQVTSESQKALDSLDGLLERNRAIQERIKSATAAPVPRSELVSDRLTAIENAQEVLRAPKPEPSMAEKALSGTAFGAITAATHAIPVIGQIPGVAHFVGAKGAEMATKLVFGKASKLGEAVAGQAKRAQDAIKAVLGATDKVAPAASVVATNVLRQVRYAHSAKDEEQPKTLPDLYKKRTTEIKQLTEYGPDGVPRMRAEARQALADRLRPIGAVDPVLADRVESIKARGIEYLSRIMPRRPDIVGAQIGPDKSHPDDLAMRSWARSVAAVEDPHGVLERAIHGQTTPEDVAAMRAVHPEILADFLNQITPALPTLRKTLPFNRQVSLSILTGEPIASALDRRVVGVLQNNFATEPGTAGGTQAPRVRPQFGNIHSIDTPTPAQRRAQGAHQ